MSDITIKRVIPKAALPGGEVTIEYAAGNLAGSFQPEVRFGDYAAQITIASDKLIVAKVPESSSETGTSELSVANNGARSAPVPL